MNSSFLEQFDMYKTSKNVAVVCGDTFLTYQDLYKYSLSLASKLRLLGVGMINTSPEHYDIYNPKATEHSPWVVIITDRSVNAVIGIIAAMMAGGSYVLMEEDVPDAYVNDIIEDTAAAVVLRNSDFINQVTPNDNLSYAFPKENEIACAVFTSGSTGRPKGAVLEHHTINEMIKWQTKYMKPARLKATACYAPLSFIAATWEIFFPLSNGLTLHILEETTRHDLFTLENYIEKNNISYMFLPPNIAELFTKMYKGNALKYLRIAGGRLKSLGDPKGKYEIMYHLGMAENGGSVTFKAINKAMDGDIPIGSEWNNTKIFLITETGEIAVSGPSLFRGYLSHPEETKKRLIKNPYSNEPLYEMLYISGDLAMIDENGEFIHIGRNDLNIKIRDMKVNPMQVERALLECTGISEGLVTTQAYEGENALIGWITGSTDIDILKKELSVRLPEYMIPSIIIKLEKLPRNINGKIDRSQLIISDSNIGTQKHSSMNYTEAKIANIFKNLLASLNRFIKADDSFLMLGGDSLKFMRLQVEIMREFAKNIPYTILYENPTPRMIAAILQNQKNKINESIPPAEIIDKYPLSAQMRQMWLLFRTGKDLGKYTVSIKCRFTGNIDISKVKTAFLELVKRNKILRSRFEEHEGEPYQIIEENIEILINNHSRHEFDLYSTPIFDISLNDNILCFTTHHIIADAKALHIIMEDFWTLYNGCEPETNIQVHDVTMWTLNKNISADENYWNMIYSDKVPKLSLPFDFKRPVRLDSSKRINIFFNETQTKKLREYAVSHNATIFQLFLAAYAILLSKINKSGESVVIGVPFSGREHPDTARVIGMFVRTLPVRLDVFGMSLSKALLHTRDRLINARNHQEVSLERLTELIDDPYTKSHNPFYDVMINYIPLPSPLPECLGLHKEIVRGEYPYALFDLILDLLEESDGITAVFTYADELFKQKTINYIADSFKNLLLTHELMLDSTYFEESNKIEELKDLENNEREIDETSPQACELLKAFKDVLKIEDVSLNDDFYVAGGTSLAAIRIEVALLEKGWLLSASDILQNAKLYEAAAKMIPLDEIDWEE